jgi:NAD(P)H-hydrate repair Nnr-like enzyme with NAD(P)H-hydrate dehydratase domain
VYVHGAAGDALARRHGDRGAVSSDLPDAIAEAIRSLDHPRAPRA